MSETYFAVTEVEQLARLINSLGIVGAQLMVRHRPDHYQRAQTNLQNFRHKNRELLDRVHSLALKSGDESALRLVEDLERVPPDAMQALVLVRRCLLASAFLGHCIAHAERSAVQPSDVQPVARQLH
jgi:hypothetical protein